MLTKIVRIIKNKIFFIKFNFIRYLRNVLEKKAMEQWNNYPFGKKPRADRNKYLQLAKEEKDKIYPEIEKYEEDCSYKINKEWLDELALHTQITLKKSQLCYAHGRVLYTALNKYLRNINEKDKITIWETGTARGS